MHFPFFYSTFNHDPKAFHMSSVRREMRVASAAIDHSFEPRLACVRADAGPVEGGQMESKWFKKTGMA